MEKKKERSEYISIWVTPEVKKEFEFSSTNNELQENILRRFIKNEVGFLEQEIKEIDDYTVRYKAKLIGIKDAFGKAQDSYVNELENIYKKTEITFNKVNDKTENVQSRLDGVNYKINNISKALENVNTYKLDSLLETLERYNKLSKDEKDLLKILVNK